MHTSEDRAVGHKTETDPVITVSLGLTLEIPGSTIELLRLTCSFKISN